MTPDTRLLTFPRRGKVPRRGGRGTFDQPRLYDPPSNVFEHPPSGASRHLPPPGEGMGRIVLAWFVASMLIELMCASSLAQPTNAPAPILRATLDTSRIVVGQPVTLRIELLVPNYLTAPPAFPDLQLRNAVTRPLGNLNLSETHEGITYAGIRHEVAIHPQEPGSYAISGQSIGFTYAVEPPRAQEATLALPPLAFEATIPEAAQGLDPFIAAARLTLRQAIDRPPGDLKVGDAVTRTVTIEAEGVPAMLLPSASPVAPEGIAVYPAQPALQDKTGQRSGTLTGTRTDRASYMMEKPGDYILPGIDIAWWNLREQKIEHARAEPVALRVMADPALPPGSVDAPTTASWWRGIAATIVDNWLSAALAIGALSVVAWFSPRMLNAARGWRQRRHATWLQSEAFLFASLRQAARRNDATATYFALVSWLARFDPVAPDRTIGALRAAARDPALDRQLALIETRLFAPVIGEQPDCSPRRLLRRIAAARRNLRRRLVFRRHDTQPLMATLNPGAPPSSARPWHRRVAR